MSSRLMGLGVTNAKRKFSPSFFDAHICSKHITIDETGSIVNKDTAKDKFYFDCEQCEFVSKYKAHLLIHMEKQHKKRKPKHRDLNQ